MPGLGLFSAIGSFVIPVLGPLLVIAALGLTIGSVLLLAGSLDWQKDFWHVPEFFELLTEQQEEYTKAITGQQDAKVTLDTIANFQEKLLEDSGRIK